MSGIVSMSRRTEKSAKAKLPGIFNTGEDYLLAPPLDVMKTGLSTRPESRRLVCNVAVSQPSVSSCRVFDDLR
jgi:hypothetical protein